LRWHVGDPDGHDGARGQSQRRRNADGDRVDERERLHERRCVCLVRRYSHTGAQRR
jgi:hypothetical protein